MVKLLLLANGECPEVVFLNSGSLYEAFSVQRLPAGNSQRSHQVASLFVTVKIPIDEKKISTKPQSKCTLDSENLVFCCRYILIRFTENEIILKLAFDAK